MLDYNPIDQELKIIIPVSGVKELYLYQKSLLSILNELEVEKMNNSRKKDLCMVYQLLGHLLLDQSFIGKHEGLLNQEVQ